MSIVISLSPEVEAQLREKAAQQGQDISVVAAQLLAQILEWELQDSQEAGVLRHHGVKCSDRYILPQKNNGLSSRYLIKLTERYGFHRLLKRRILHSEIRVVK